MLHVDQGLIQTDSGLIKCSCPEPPPNIHWPLGLANGTRLRLKVLEMEAADVLSQTFHHG